jgi:hypothetical protein
MKQIIQKYFVSLQSYNSVMDTTSNENDKEADARTKRKHVLDAKNLNTRRCKRITRTKKTQGSNSSIPVSNISTPLASIPDNVPSSSQPSIHTQPNSSIVQVQAKQKAVIRPPITSINLFNKFTETLHPIPSTSNTKTTNQGQPSFTSNINLDVNEISPETDNGMNEMENDNILSDDQTIENEQENHQDDNEENHNSDVQSDSDSDIDEIPFDPANLPALEGN